MGYFPLDIPPGVVKTDSDYGARGRYIDTEKTRFVASRPEKIGGWEKRIETALTGTARGAPGRGPGGERVLRPGL